MKTIDWNKASQMNLIEKINREYLHPRGLAICREPDTGKSPGLVVADDLVFTYGADKDLSPSDGELQAMLEEIIKGGEGDKAAP